MESAAGELGRARWIADMTLIQGVFLEHVCLEHG